MLANMCDQLTLVDPITVLVNMHHQLTTPEVAKTVPGCPETIMIEMPAAGGITIPEEMSATGERMTTGGKLETGGIILPAKAETEAEVETEAEAGTGVDGGTTMDLNIISLMDQITANTMTEVTMSAGTNSIVTETTSLPVRRTLTGTGAIAITTIEDQTTGVLNIRGDRGGPSCS